MRHDDPRIQRLVDEQMERIAREYGWDTGAAHVIPVTGPLLSALATLAKEKGCTVEEEVESGLSTYLIIASESARLQKEVDRRRPGDGRIFYKVPGDLALDVPLGCPCVGTPDEEDCPHE